MPAILRKSLPNLFASIQYSQSLATVDVVVGSRPPGLIVWSTPDSGIVRAVPTLRRGVVDWPACCTVWARVPRRCTWGI